MGEHCQSSRECYCTLTEQGCKLVLLYYIIFNPPFSPSTRWYLFTRIKEVCVPHELEKVVISGKREELAGALKDEAAAWFSFGAICTHKSSCNVWAPKNDAKNSSKWSGTLFLVEKHVKVVWISNIKATVESQYTCAKLDLFKRRKVTQVRMRALLYNCWNGWHHWYYSISIFGTCSSPSEHKNYRVRQKASLFTPHFSRFSTALNIVQHFCTFRQWNGALFWDFDRKSWPFFSEKAQLTPGKCVKLWRKNTFGSLMTLIRAKLSN